MTMPKISRILLMALALIVISASVSGQVPQLINYQGRMTDASGNPIDTVVAVYFTIYDHETDPTAKMWEEGHDGVTVTDGLFNVTLGFAETLPDDIFASDTTRWLGVRIGTDEEMEPRTRLITVPYAYHALRADTAEYVVGGSDACGWTLSGNDIQMTDPDDTVSVGASGGGALVNVSAFGANPGETHMTGLGVLLNNGVTSGATGGYFSAAGPGGRLIGVEAFGNSSTSDTVFALKGNATNYGAGAAIGAYGECDHQGIGRGYGGYFRSGGVGNGARFGVGAYVTTSSDWHATGVFGEVRNSGSGGASGLSCLVGGEGSGEKFGVAARAENNSSANTYGQWITAETNGEGYVCGSHIEAISHGNGRVVGSYVEATTGADSLLRGIDVIATGNTPSASVTGINAAATNNGSGMTTGGAFWAYSGGTGTHIGVYGSETAGGTGAAVYAAGDIDASGTKSAVMRVSKGTILMYAMESAEVWFEDFGEGRLSGGKTHIKLDPLFLETVTIDDAHPMKAFIQLNDDCNGTYVKTSATGFDVYELNRGTSDAAFTWRVVAKRKGYEDERMRATDVGCNDPNLYPERAEEIYERMGFSR